MDNGSRGGFFRVILERAWRYLEICPCTLSARQDPCQELQVILQPSIRRYGTRGQGPNKSIHGVG